MVVLIILLEMILLEVSLLLLKILGANVIYYQATVMI